jgi:Putative MetA-pathway of phenol degradation
MNNQAHLQNNGICHDNPAGTRIVFKHLYKVDVHRKKEGTMKKVAAISLALASSVFALDEYMPIAPKTLEIDAGVSHVKPDGVDAFQGIPLAVKYGITADLTVELASAYSLQDNASGLTQPAVALKYKLPNLDLAAFVNVVLPFATGDQDVPGLNLGVAPGVLYNHAFGPVSTIFGAYYQLNFESDDVKDGNVLSLLAKPSYGIDEKLAAYVGVNYVMYGESELAGTGVGDDGYALTLSPGVTYTLSKSVAFEANIPFVVAEDNVGKSWGINALVYYTLPL